MSRGKDEISSLANISSLCHPQADPANVVSVPALGIGPRSNRRLAATWAVSRPMINQRLKIGIVDDDQSVRKALFRLCGSAGFGVETFASGREFLDSLEKQRPDCV